ncbi:phosphoesterase PA-phosphatase related protein [Pseudonocardia dioxanivorans CB1190]|uniref:Phosphoesterase PA-phosphatase related protein n=1 Tax=Pseudonocardia dioxanivorans (strain ATCC 55486 / DSM 44775 / JCM 13855 / CB1190) TaxID=675635 RepID=F4CWZ0_PSEUX|nr:phosphatase PAP2 family protein [Pseudonocardia dioxanivorans]AEA24245.1 phosphoesterase PA-phosphatase related protein [Pseudonocardia dioxanivorans CB1190]
MPSGPRARLAVAVGLVGVLGLAAGWLLHAGLTGSGPAAADPTVLADFLDVRTPDLTTAAVVVTTVGSTAAMAGLAAAACVLLWLRGHRRDVLFLAAATIGASALFRLLKALFDRARPPAATRLVTETNESLPSGHATMSLVVVGALVVVGWHAWGVRTRVAVLTGATLWVLAVGATRLYLGVHWFSDVLAGWLVGATWLTVCVLVRRTWPARATSRAGPAGGGPAGRTPARSVDGGPADLLRRDAVDLRADAPDADGEHPDRADDVDDRGTGR